MGIIINVDASVAISRINDVRIAKYTNTSEQVAQFTFIPRWDNILHRSKVILVNLVDGSGSTQLTITALSLSSLNFILQRTKLI